MEKLDIDKKSKNKKIGVVSLFVLAVVLVIGTSFALWQLTFTQSGTNVITTGCLNLTLTDDTDAINLTNATPTSDTDGKTLTPYTFTLENTCNTDTRYVVNLESVSTGDKILADQYVKANLIRGTEEVFLDKLVASHENGEKVITDASAAYMLSEGTLAGKEKVQFSLRLWMDEGTGPLDEVMNATWKGKITITASYVPKEVGVSLYDIIKNQASLDDTSSEFVTSQTGINFGVAPSDTNGKGVYTISSTKDSRYPVHYFRGAITNNNVKFARLCWKIVRTTETGGVKLIYNGIPDASGGCTNTTGPATQLSETSEFNTSHDLESYVGYMYPETNENNSTIKTVIDTWYENNMTDYTSYLEDTVWCNDRSVYKTEGVDIYYGAIGRNVESHNPSIVCPNDNDKFTVNSANGNGKLIYPVSLLTADEMTLAGHGNAGYSDNSYLYTNQNWWGLSPYKFSSNDATVFKVDPSGILRNNRVDYNTHGVRPSVSLAPGTTVSDGDGNQNTPFIIKTN